ncbi:hypothetical protein [Halomarina rubra]|uniref:Uncharacterized protein n=1 Tax=Halomarina rubra TaxID=2071873 RepID=A0ABD6AWF5_9EURY|nr:hypothetical protein [Halomarina rubra]
MFIDGNLMMFVILGGVLSVILALYLMFRRTVLAFNEGVDERR